MKIPGIIYKSLMFILRKTQKLVGASLVGVRALVVNEQQEVLLVKHTYAPDWYLPGGGVDANETPQIAIIRELQEETGIESTTVPELMSVHHHKFVGLDDYVICYLVKNFTKSPCDSPEIAEIKWFHYQALPQDMNLGSARRIKEYFYNIPPNDTW